MAGLVVVAGLPALRQELTLYPAPAAGDGSPTWHLHDPPANRFYRLGWAAFEILSRWDLGNPEAVAAAVNRETTLAITAADVERVAEFLIANHLVSVTGARGVARLLESRRAARRHWAHWLLHNYLFFKVPLVRPQSFLNAAAPVAEWLFTPLFRGTVVLAFLFGTYLVARQWDSFVTTFSAFGSWRDLVWLGVALTIAKVLHELGHAFSAHRYGCRVGSMGVAFLVMWPVLYTDVNEAWKLERRRERLVIGSAGMAAELTLAVFATLAWSFLPEGPLRAAAFFLATTTWVMTLAVNLSPFMRFDGYFLLCDLLGEHNLHHRAFAMGRWWLREALFGLGEHPPEPLPPGRRRFFIGFAFGTWLYRFLLFLGIAYVVYLFFFKALGVFLMLVEIGWFIVLPIAREVGEWWGRRRRLTWNRRTLTTAAVLAALVLVLVLPWRGELAAPAIRQASRHQAIYMPFAARVGEVHVAQGQTVAEGQRLITLASPDLAYDIEQSRREVQMLTWQRERQGFGEELREQGEALLRRLEEAESRLRAREDEAARLAVRATLSGVVAELNEQAVPGSWLGRAEPLAYLVAPHEGGVEAFVPEAALGRLKKDVPARFYPENPEWGEVECRVAEVDSAGTQRLEYPYLASPFGGDIAVREDGDGGLVPEQAQFRVRLHPCEPFGAPDHILRGHAVLPVGAESPLSAIWRRVSAVLIRESGF